MKSNIRSQALWIGVLILLLYGVIGWSVGPVFGEGLAEQQGSVITWCGGQDASCRINDLSERIARLERFLRLTTNRVTIGDVYFTRPEDEIDSIDLGDVIRSARRTPKISGPDYEIKDEKKK